MCKMHVLRYIVLLTLCGCTVYCREEKADESFQFDVIPGGSKLSYEEKWHGVTCKFTYVCQGGTKEKWEMHLSRDDSHNYYCIIGRPAEATMSYLFFQEFDVAIDGASLLNAEVYGSNSDKPADRKEYNLDIANNKVSSSRDFQSSLTMVVLTMAKSREEL